MLLSISFTFINMFKFKKSNINLFECNKTNLTKFHFHVTSQKKTQKDEKITEKKKSFSCNIGEWYVTHQLLVMVTNDPGTQLLASRNIAGPIHCYTAGLS